MQSIFRAASIRPETLIAGSISLEQFARITHACGHRERAAQEYNLQCSAITVHSVSAKLPLGMDIL